MLFRATAGLLAALALAAPLYAQEAAPRQPSAPIPYNVLRPQARRAPTPPKPAAAAAQAQAQAQAPVDPNLEAFVDGLARDAMASDHIAGLAVAVVQNGRVTLAKGYGFADLDAARRVDADRTLFRLGGVSSTFGSIAILKEAEAGRMRLDAPVNIYLPQRLQVRDQGFNQPVRVRDLMDHTAGFENRMLGQLFQTDPARVRPLATYLRQERPDRVREPGATPAYSTYGAALAGEAVAQVAGMSFDRLVAERILGPAGMRRTTFRQPTPPAADRPAPMDPTLAADLSRGYRWNDGGLQARPFQFIEAVPAGAGSSTASDMGRFMRLMLGGGNIDGAVVYGPATAHALTTPLWRPASGGPGWRQGLAEVQLPGGRLGLGQTGSTLMFHSNMVLAPDLGLGVFVVANTDTGARFVTRLPDAIVERFYGPTVSPPPKGDPALYDRRGAYEGRYLSTRRAYGGLEGFIVGLFRAGTLVKVSPDGYLTTREAGDVQRWAPVSETRFQSVDSAETLDFAVDNGRAVRILGNMAVRDRAPFWFGPILLTIIAGLVAAASAGALASPLLRDRREFRQAQVQARAGMIQATQSALWLMAFVAFGVWSTGVGDVSQIVQRWPGVSLLIASTCALVAAVLSLPVLVLLPWAWRGGRRVDSWTTGRKLRFTATALLFAAFSLLLALTGALAPWDA